MVTTFNFSDFISSLDSIGFYDVALPFLLVFTIVFAILQKIKIFGEKGKNFNAVIALVMAFLVVRSDTIIQTMNLFLPKVSLISIIIISVLLLVGLLLGKESAGFSKTLGGVGMILIIGAVAVAFLSSSGSLGLEIPSWLNVSSYDRNLLIGFAVFFILILWVTADGSSTNSFGSKIKTFIEELPESFGKSS